MIAEDYLDLPYHFILLPDHWDDGTPGWFIRVDELEGCMSQGRTPDEALERIRDAMLGWIDVSLQDGQDIPLPRPDDDGLGWGLIARVPGRVVDAAAEAAAREGISLDQYVANALVAATSRKPAAARRAG
jgi:predicted RNase H-like HicB family nuclease